MAEYSHDALSGGASDQEQQASSLPDTTDISQTPSTSLVELDALEAQGFTHNEALQLVYTSERLAQSREARESEALLRRLRFQRWLLDRGVLDEFSA